MPIRYRPEVITKCYSEIIRLREEALELEKEYQNELAQIPEEYRESAKNLLHYIAIRGNDIRELQVLLGHMGLSSLGRMEAHVMAALESILMALQRISPTPLQPEYNPIVTLQFKDGDDKLKKHTQRLLGNTNPQRRVRIMVTLPTHASTDYAMIKQLILSGMNIARINCAHDDTAVWTGMIENIKKATSETGKDCKIMMDLAGPKLRTGDIEEGPSVLHIQPIRDERGIIIKSGFVKIKANNTGSTFSQDELEEISIDESIYKFLKNGDIIKFTDIPGRKRSLKVFHQAGNYMVAETDQSTYLENHLPFEVYRGDTLISQSEFRDIPNIQVKIILNKNDQLIITTEIEKGKAAVHSLHGDIIEPARIPCTLPIIMKQVKPGERILFDDGKISGIIEDVNTDFLTVRIKNAGFKGTRLSSDKGINLPDSSLDIPSLNDYDKECLQFAIASADMVGLSFVRKPQDIEEIQKIMNEANANHIGIILKIENKQGFENLPNLLITGLKNPPLGVMVARGDLGVELGFDRMAEVQEQILWFCEAAHTPVIWATQVLDQMNKKGLPTRSEVTDAAMSARAECVMLNKGPYVIKTVNFLHSILSRMQDHQEKKTAMLRKLNITDGIWHS